MMQSCMDDKRPAPKLLHLTASFPDRQAQLGTERRCMTTVIIEQLMAPLSIACSGFIYHPHGLFALRSFQEVAETPFELRQVLI